MSVSVRLVERERLIACSECHPELVSGSNMMKISGMDYMSNMPDQVIETRD